MRQVFVSLGAEGGRFFNFVNGSSSTFESLAWYLRCGWIVKHIHLDHASQSGYCILEKARES